MAHQSHTNGGTPIEPSCVSAKMICSIIAKLGEQPVVSHKNGTQVDDDESDSRFGLLLSPQKQRFTLAVCNLMTIMWKDQKLRMPSKVPKLRYRLVGTTRDSMITVEINHIPVIDDTLCNSLFLGSGVAIQNITFLFKESPEEKQLTFGRILIDIKVAESYIESKCGGSAKSIYKPPTVRRPRTVEIDWTNSCVLETDRTIIVNIIDDVNNIHAMMPLDLTYSLDPIHSETIDIETTQAAATPLKRKRFVDENDDDASVESSAGESFDEQVIGTRQKITGYCLVFTGVPSFSASFLDFLIKKYESHSVTAVVIFPFQRKITNTSIHTTETYVKPRLSVSLRCSGTLVQDFDRSARSVSKRMRAEILNSVVNNTGSSD